MTRFPVICSDLIRILSYRTELKPAEYEDSSWQEFLMRRGELRLRECPTDTTIIINYLVWSVANNF